MYKVFLSYIYKQFHAFSIVLDKTKPQRKKKFLRTGAPEVDSNQPAHLHSLIRIFTGCICDKAKDAKFLHTANEN